MMSMTLPYRTDGNELTRFLDALARGRHPDQIQTLNFSRKGFEGTVLAAQELGFVSKDAQALTETGRQFVLASEKDRRAIVLDALFQYEPYGLLLEAIGARGESATPTEWIEAWWSTHGFGTSGTNRVEGSTALARFLEFVEHGTYVQGRRGHPSRVEWRTGALSLLNGTSPATQESAAPEPADPFPATQDVAARDRNSAREEPPTPGPASAELRLPLSDNRFVYMKLPSRVSAAEKARILALLGHLIEVAEPNVEEVHRSDDTS